MEQKTKQNKTKSGTCFFLKPSCPSLLKWAALEMGWVAVEGTVKVQLGAWDESGLEPSQSLAITFCFLGGEIRGKVPIAFEGHGNIKNKRACEDRTSHDKVELGQQGTLPMCYLRA